MHNYSNQESKIDHKIDANKLIHSLTHTHVNPLYFKQIHWLLSFRCFNNIECLLVKRIILPMELLLL